MIGRMNVMEKQLKIRVSKKHHVYGKLSGKSTQPLFIMVHGLPGNMDESFYTDAARWFRKHGLATFRLNLYDWQKGARQLVGSTLETHAADIDTIVKYFRKQGFKKVFIAGHSYGGPSILLSKKQDFNAAALWDPSYKNSFTKTKYGDPEGRYIKELDGYFMHAWGVNVVIGKAMADEADTLDWDSLTPNFKVPLLIATAGNGVLKKGHQAYFKKANSPKKHLIIPGATHYFSDTPKIQDSLFKATYAWFKKFS